jgi:signal transduction histidine kinase
MSGADSEAIAVDLSQGLRVTIAAIPVDKRQRKIALGVVLLLVTITTTTAPFAGRPGVQIASFIPVLQTVLCILDLTTATLIFSQYSVRPHPAVLAIASGYLFSGSFAFLQTLAFPGAYAPQGLIGDGTNSAAWLFVCWQTTFILAIGTYALLKHTKISASAGQTSAMAKIMLTVACTFVATAGLTLLVTKATPYLPALYVNGIIRQTPLAKIVNVCLLILSVATFGLLLVRMRTILDIWLAVTLLAWWQNFIFAILFTGVRFSIGWYIGRCFGLVASSIVLVVLLAEMTLLYARLANSIVLSHRERAQRLASVEAATSAMAHKIRRPLTGISSMGAAGLDWLRRNPANVEKASACLTSIADASHRAEEIIGSIRGLVRKTPSQRTVVQFNDVCREVMRLVQHELIANGISVTVKCAQDLPQVRADFIQLQQVMLNLVRNAIDVMSERPLTERRLRVRSSFDGKSTVSVFIRDTGAGVPVEGRERIFDAFYTTKRSGTGLGLAVSRTIIEEH